ncbi:hypothetical protein [Curvivirga sp.]|uniref:hypothetical protein n=1 Tax=Curvivirga sp. TaxID=2856848 RepID=UPI003B596F36
MRWPLVTGANDFVFPNLLIFLESMHEFMPDEKIYVADFGLTDAQIRYLDAQGYLLPLPEKLREYDHAWYRKASLYDYLTPLGVDGFVWLDCDMILAEDFRPAMSSIMEEMEATGADISICQDAGGMTFQSFYDFGKSHDADIEPFKNLAAAMGCPMESAYLNSGVMILNGMELPMLWGAMTRKQHQWLLFEQCSLNLLVQNGSRKMKMLDCREWNAHGPFLEDVMTEKAPYTSRIVHVTSSGKLHFNQEFKYDHLGKSISGNLKLFVREDLRKTLLDNFASSFERNGELMVETGLLV